MDLENRYKQNMTVQDLLDFIEKHNIPRDGKVMIQRVEDWYYGKGNWETYNKEGFQYHQAKEMNAKIDSGEFNDKDNYPDIEDPEKYRTTEEGLEALKEQYHPAWSPVLYKDEKHLFLDLHY